MVRHNAPGEGQSTSEAVSGIPQGWRPAHQPRHAAAEPETTPMDLPARGAGIVDPPRDPR